MKNGYFQLVKCAGGYGLRVVPPEEGGESVRLNEVTEYLGKRNIVCGYPELSKAVSEGKETIVFLEPVDCPPADEAFKLTISEDKMEASVRFYPPSDIGRRMTMDEFIRELRQQKVAHGIQMGVLQGHFQEGVYCTDLVVARGKPPRHGTDAVIEYYFNTDVHARPTQREDGSVDFFNLNTINHCKKGDVLARIIPEEPGEAGVDIQGNRIKPRDVKKATFKYSNNIAVSEDKLSLTTLVDGHVTLVEGKVFVSDVFEVENVDNSTGNVDFEGSVQVNGNIQSNFMVSARGNVIIKGVVEGAHIEAGGDIIIARGMNGMGKGTLKAGRNVVAKFIENATISAEGYVTSGAILHSRVMAGTEVEVDGKRGFITGGHVSASNRITVKTLGSDMGASTIVEVGVSPHIKQEYQGLQKDIGEIVKTIKQNQPLVANFIEKRSKGVRFSQEQIKYVVGISELLQLKKNELEEKNNRIKELQDMMESQNKSAVVVKDVVYPGTTIVIGDVSMIVQSNYSYCRFEKVQGDVKMLPM